MQKATNTNELEEDEEVSLGDLFYKFIPYWPFFLMLVVISLAGCLDISAL